ncbi:thioredoxin family protein [Hydrogenothermus marinus]|uniref:Thioredoxin-related protein n=1 Tax=Hydrogenothermus marinus TaxID=133270 RepID=A0A3M0B9L4_9AQUI|nr:thioredoxin fold domain-containing protein [Hydrogenothermus marinus]RMA93276.1 thioredoxin-related protein [Hydrogenothermus marinus]
MRKILTIFSIFVLFLAISACNKKENQQSEKFKVDPYPVIKDAMKNHKYLMIVFESEECQYCSKLNKEVLNQLDFKEKLIKNNIEVAIVNVYGNRKVIDPETKNEMEEKVLAYLYHVQGFPTTAIFDPTQNYKLLYKFTGYVPKDNFANLVDFIGSSCYKKIPFEKYLENNKKC